MKIIKNEKGITLIALVVTMIVIMILTVAFTANISSTMELNKYYRVKEDIIALTDEVQNYYNENGSLPVSGASFTFECTENPDEKNPNDNNKYYTIDTTLLDVDIQSKDSTYIVNQRSLTVYCKEGVILDNIRHYTIYEFEKVNYGDYLLPRNGSIKYFWTYKNRVTEVYFENSINIPSSIEIKWDMTADGNGQATNSGRVMAWLDGTVLHIAQKGGVQILDASSLFEGFQYLEKINNLDTVKTKNTINMARMFYGCNKLTSLDLSNFDTSSVTNMSHMFYGCYKLTSLDLRNFDTSNVTSMSCMFYYCYGLENLNLSSFDTKNVTNMNHMFYYSGSNYLTSLDLSSFDTSNVTDMAYMFGHCTYLTSLDLSSFNTKNVTDMSHMFDLCKKLTSLDLSSFDTSNVVNVERMFSDCTILTSLDISKFDVSNVTDMAYMFANCTKLTTIYLTSSTASLLSDVLPSTATLVYTDAN